MKYKIKRDYTANSNRFTFGLIILVMLGFGAVAQSDELQAKRASTQSTISQTIVPSLCNSLDRVQVAVKQPLFLMQ